jgi:hypothetical protein
MTQIDLNQVVYMRSQSSVLLPQALQRLSEHAMHLGNCTLESWSPRLVRCKCGLFQLLTKLERMGVLDRTHTKGDR